MRRASPCLALWAATLLGGLGVAHAAPSPRAVASVETSRAAAAPASVGELPGNIAKAREHYARAVALYDAGAHAAALTEFQRAYSLRPSYQLLFNIGQLELLLQRPEAARQSLERYLHEGGSRVSTARRADVLQQLDALPEIAEPTAREAVTKEVGPVRAPRDAQRGSPDGTAAAPPSVQPSRTLSVATVAWVSTGALGLGALGCGVATLLTSRQYERLRSTPAAPEDAARARDELDRQRARLSRLATVTDVLAITTLASATLSLYFTLWQGSATEAEPALSFELTPGGVSATGSF